MIYEQNITKFTVYEQTKELDYQVSQFNYHLKNYLLSLQEAQQHLAKATEHAVMVNGLKESFTNGAAYV